MSIVPNEPAVVHDRTGWGAIPRSLRGQLTGHEIAVYIALSWRSDPITCWCRHKVLADDAGVSVNTVKRALDSLRDKGVVTWEPRYGDDGEVICNTYTLIIAAFGGQPTGTEGVALTGLPPSPVRATEEEPLKKNPGRTTPLPPTGFEEWYAVYPRKEKPADARKAYAEAITKISPADLLAATLPRVPYLRHQATKDPNNNYCPLPATWLRAESWADEVIAAPRKSKEQRDLEAGYR